MMTNSNLACQKNIVNFPALSIVDDNKPKYRKDGGVKRTHPNKLAGVSTEVYGFYSKEEIKMIMDVLEERISLAEHKVENHVTRSATQLRVARRNKLMFIIGMNIGIRASDLSVIKGATF
jgi:hypothetical protein